MCVDDAIKIIFERSRYILAMDEYNFYLDTCKISRSQEFMVINYFSNSFGGEVNFLNTVDRKQFMKLVTYLAWSLRINNSYFILPDILTGTVLSINENQTTTQEIQEMIRKSVYYEAVMRHYSDMRKEIESNFAIETPLVEMLNIKFNYNRYGYKKNGTPIEYKTDRVCEEYLRFLDESCLYSEGLKNKLVI